MNFRIIISPAKKMQADPDTLPPAGLPRFLAEADRLRDWLAGLCYKEQKDLWRCNDSIARLNVERLSHMDLTHNLTPALLSYEGLQYQYMAPVVFSKEELSYVQAHLCILSGFYGMLRPLDGVTPYRLEMQAKGAPDGKKNLYEFWGDCIYEAVTDGAACMIVNLASREYARCITPYLKPGDLFLTCVFGEWKEDRVIQKGTLDKMARGEMVRYMAEKKVKQPEEIQAFDRLGYRFHPELSSEEQYIFLREFA